MEQRVLAIDIRVAQIERAPEIALSGPLDLYDARAHVREPQRRQRPRKKLAEIEDQQAVQGLIVLSFVVSKDRMLSSILRRGLSPLGAVLLLIEYCIYEILFSLEKL